MQGPGSGEHVWRKNQKARYLYDSDARSKIFIKTESRDRTHRFEIQEAHSKASTGELKDLKGKAVWRWCVRVRERPTFRHCRTRRACLGRRRLWSPPPRRTELRAREPSWTARPCASRTSLAGCSYPRFASAVPFPSPFLSFTSETLTLGSLPTKIQKQGVFGF